jgi:hypothetical protein
MGERIGPLNLPPSVRNTAIGMTMVMAVSGCALLEATQKPRELERSSTRIGGDYKELPDVITGNPFVIAVVPKRGEGAPEITKTLVTADWNSAVSQDIENPDAWQVLCTITSNDTLENEIHERDWVEGEIYYCETDLDNFNSPPQSGETVVFSFDVYNAANEYKLAPDGMRERPVERTS